MGAPETGPSLRERSKAKRRDLIRRTAMRLFAERGYDHATIADIAAEAEVAPRTVTMYFPSKADIARSLPEEIAGRLHDFFKGDPELSFTDGVARWLSSERDHVDPELMALAAAMYDANPSLRSLGSADLAESIALVGAAFGTETGLPADDPLSRVIGAAVGAALSQYLFDGLHRPEQPRLQEDFIRMLRTLMASGRRPIVG
jgi:AcrR family transcriptional regulator